MSVPQGYQRCCTIAALDNDSVFCPECGRNLFRCVAFERCQNLVGAFDSCTACIRPMLILDETAVLDARVGETLSIPFRICNPAAAPRGFSVLNVFKDFQKTRHEPVPLRWESVEPGQERGFSVDTGVLPSAGVSTLRMTLVIASCYGGFEEHYAFCGEVKIDVESMATAPSTHIDMRDAKFDQGVIYMPSGTRDSGSVQRLPSALAGKPVPLERAERFELENGYRGYTRNGRRIPRNANFVFTGFPAGDRPIDGPLAGVAPVLRCGRNSRRHDAERNPQPNDLCLRAYETAGGAPDIETSRGIARHLCDFLLQNDRLYVRSHGDHRMVYNGEPLHAMEMRVVEDGDLIALPAGHPGAFSLIVRFSPSSGVVETVRLERSPPVMSWEPSNSR